MMRRIAVCLVSLMLTSPVWAQDQEPKETPPATGGSGTPTDMSKMGPWTRKPTNEAKTRKEIEAWVKEGDAIMKQRNFEADIARADFPVYMATDNSKGVPMAETYDRQKYVEMMKPMFDEMPADMQVKHKLDITVLSDSLVTFKDDYTLTMGGEKRQGRNAGLLVKRDGQWKWKAFFEAGWGDMPSEAVGGSGMHEEPEKPQ
ncbi:hypothetical protein JRI60_27295 [Archangium violaceum]|uniref:hypothetical protein n=1 Tax=Archangium violaceum TaxID=83451 RepID=UPI00194FF630|nr:hypothetical protein [Archangium violaceum]QRN92918.1 hypothetical protein JRI60_27295 [Archangium violaceum]